MTDLRLAVGTDATNAQAEAVLDVLDRTRVIVRVGDGLDPVAAIAAGALVSMVGRLHGNVEIDGDAPFELCGDGDEPERTARRLERLRGRERSRGVQPESREDRACTRGLVSDACGPVVPADTDVTRSGVGGHRGPQADAVTSR